MSLSSDASQWTPQEDYILMMLVGRATYAQIAIRLGRSEGAVQRRASYKGYSQHGEKRSDRQARRSALSEILERNLSASEDELAEFLPEVD